MSTNTIRLNGKVYDSRTGKPVGAAPAAHVAAKKTVSKPAHEAAPGTKAAATHPKKPVHAHHTAVHKTPHKTQKTRTLMRHVVKRPLISAASAPAGSEGAHEETVSLLLPQLSESRLKHAQQVPKSKMISRFGSFSTQPSLVKKTAHVPVKAHPTADISQHEAAPPTDLFTNGLQQATGHTQRAPHVKHRHTAARPARRKSLVAVVAAIALLGGFFAYQNKPNVEFRVAAAKAGIHATLPGYRPSGFAMKGPIQYAPGQVAIRFQSNSDSRNFTVSQQVSNWNSQALLDNYVSSTDNNYQTVQDKGRTIYIYGGSNATWVDGGIWYQIQGTSDLSSSQLVKIASSI